jgi:hypothetical protein
LETSAEFQSPQDVEVQALPETAEPPVPAEIDVPFHLWSELSRATQNWIQWGTLGFAIFCIVIGAVEALFGR